MKISCQSCGAKYTISDEKVRGRTVKIRCKKCSSAIVVKGPEEGAVEEEEEDDATRVYGGGSDGSSEWTLSLDDDQKSVSELELTQLLASGTITEETYVWREGMDDWLMINQIPELAHIMQGGAGFSAPPPAEPSIPPYAASQPAPDAQMGDGLFGGGGGGAAARVAPRGRNQDLFGAKAPQEQDVASTAPEQPASMPVPKHTFTAERGENSVLFTIDAIKAIGKAPGAGSAPMSMMGDEEKVDFGALASTAPPALEGGSGYDDLMGIGGASFVAGGMLNAPMLPTELEPEPEPEPEPVMPGMMGASFAPPPKSNKGLIIGLGAAVALLLVVSLAFGGYVLFAGEEKPVAANTTPTDGDKTGATPGEDDKGKADEAKTDEAKADEAKTDGGEAKADEDKADGGKADDDKKDDKKDPKALGGPTTTATVGGPLPPSTAKKDDKKDPKADDKKDPKADDKKAEPAAAGGAPFSRSAAISALGSAAGAASGCKKPDGPTGRGRVSVTFAPSGRVTTAVVSGGPFAGTSVGGCVAGVFRRASVPPFVGSPVTVHKSFSIN